MNLGSKPTNPGELRTPVTLLKRTVTKSTGGFQKPATSVIGTAWAKWENIHGADVWAATAQGVSAAATVLIRYNAQVDATCLVQLGSDVYEIVSVDDIRERHEYMELKVKRMEAA